MLTFFDTLYLKKKIIFILWLLIPLIKSRYNYFSNNRMTSHLIFHAFIFLIVIFCIYYILQCPKCNICIEKNGGCNHMQCYHCKHDFCWMCLGDWKTHGSEYYECSRYKENPNIGKILICLK